MNLDDPDPAQLDALLRSERASNGEELAGPVQVRSKRRSSRGAEYELGAIRLVPADPDDPELKDVSIALPATVHVEVDDAGRVVSASVDEPAGDETREARAFVRSLRDSGAIRGMGSARARGGFPTRPTHELTTDASGRRLIRRIGFSLR